MLLEGLARRLSPTSKADFALCGSVAAAKESHSVVASQQHGISDLKNHVNNEFEKQLKKGR